MTMHPMLGSSVDPERLALTFKGAIPLVIFIGAYLGVELEATTLDEIITLVGLIVSSAVTLVGLIRKIIISYQNR